MLNQRWFAGAQRLLALITSAVAAFFLATGPALGQAGLPPAPAGVQITSTYGIEFATVSGANNPGIPWDTLHSGLDQAPFQLQGRGSVSHDYRIARSETTTSQWMAFINTFAGRSDYPTQIRDVIGFELRFGPHFWGAAPDPRYNGPGFQYTLDTTSPASGMQPVGGISWRAAAMYCNWLHNGQSSDWSTLLDGAYDVATFGRSAQEPLNYTDAPGHRPDARFWIPTLDEWMKAAYYDPNRAGPGQGGWWRYVNRSDAPPTVGPPGTGTTSAGLYDYQNNTPAFWSLPLGSYPDQQSAFGLFDTSGGASELGEDYYDPNRYDPPRYESRYLFGAHIGIQRVDPGFEQYVYGDLASRFNNAIGGTDPSGGNLVNGLRVVAAIPAPATWTMMFAMITSYSFRKRLK